VSFRLHLLSAGGLLANDANQLDITRRDGAVRPGMIFFGTAVVLGLVVTTAVAYPDAAGLAISACGLGVAILMWLGWFAGLVPFEPLPVGAATPVAAPAWADSQLDLEVRVTGVVEDTAGNRRRYRDRLANLAGTRLTVYTKAGAIDTIPVTPDFGPPTISMIECGTAYLVASERPAIRVHWKHGSVILTFDDPEWRDRVFARMVGRPWQPRPLW
jgi:hypothetical protein